MGRRLDVLVQHHPSRGHLLGGLSALGAHRVVTDPQPDAAPSAIRTYIECLRAPGDGSHVLIVQDDAAPCQGFRERAEAALAERPDVLVTFFVPCMALYGRVMREAHRAGHPWCLLPGSVNWAPTVALAWPRPLAAEFLPYAVDYVETRRARGQHTTGDDPIVGRFRRERKLPLWATVPSLVEHPDPAPSLVKGRLYDGDYRNRRAAVAPG